MVYACAGDWAYSTSSAKDALLPVILVKTCLCPECKLREVIGVKEVLSSIQARCALPLLQERVQ